VSEGSSGGPRSSAAGPGQALDQPDQTGEELGQALDDEVHRQRRAGAFPPGFERRLDELFARVTPRGAGERDTAAAIEAVEESVSIDLDVPVASRKPGLEVVKRAIRAGVTWYFNYVVIQLRQFTLATLRVLHILDARVTDLEAESAVRRPPPLPAGSPGPPTVDPAAWGWLVGAELSGARGLVLHGDCGTGNLLRLLAPHDGATYGVDPRAPAPPDADQPGSAARAGVQGAERQGGPLAGLDVRQEEVADHLRSLPEGALGGLVLSGCVDRAGLPEKHELAYLAASRLAPGAKVVVLGTAPGAWQRALPADVSALVEADLAPGRPLHPETWAHLLSLAGLEIQATHLEPARRRLDPVPGEGPATETLNANLAVLERTLFGPESYAVVAVRPG
jgi:hypothetical protein